MKRFVPPPHPPTWINTDEELPEGPLDMRQFFILDVPPRRRDDSTDEEEKTLENEEAQAIFDQVAEEWWKNGPGTK